MRTLACPSCMELLWEGHSKLLHLPPLPPPPPPPLSLSLVPYRTSTIHPTSLQYDRSRMRRPSVDGPRAPLPGNHSPKAGGGGGVDEESYVPKIALSTRGWQAFVARHYYRLNNLKLLVTFLINVVLLSFTVSSAACGFTPCTYVCSCDWYSTFGHNEHLRHLSSYYICYTLLNSNGKACVRGYLCMYVSKCSLDI